ncbi:unnamed protein product, partial [Ectocarpus sp. 12 AP-2014]
RGKRCQHWRWPRAFCANGQTKEGGNKATEAVHLRSFRASFELHRVDDATRQPGSRRAGHAFSGGVSLVQVRSSRGKAGPTEITVDAESS